MVAAHSSRNPKASRCKSFELSWASWACLDRTEINVMQDLNNIAKLPEARRSTRVKQGGATDISRAPYMTWTNRKAVSMS